MKLIIFNGSPRGKESNTALLTDQFIKGIQSVKQIDVEIYYLAARSQRAEGAKAFRNADVVLLATPLYTDSMPGIVKDFIEKLEDFCGMDNNPDMGFLIQSGFPEPAHSRYLQKYFEKLTIRLRANYIGTIVKGGVEGIRIMPGWMTRKLYGRFFSLGSSFAKTGEIDQKIVRKLAPHEQFTKRGRFFFKLMHRSRFANFYWNSLLKANGAFERRFDRPFQSSLAFAAEVKENG